MNKDLKAWVDETCPDLPEEIEGSLNHLRKANAPMREIVERILESVRQDYSAEDIYYLREAVDVHLWHYFSLHGQKLHELTNEVIDLVKTSMEGENGTTEAA